MDLYVFFFRGSLWKSVVWIGIRIFCGRDVARGVLSVLGPSEIWLPSNPTKAKLTHPTKSMPTLINMVIAYLSAHALRTTHRAEQR